MKSIYSTGLLVLVLIISSPVAAEDTYIDGYIRQDGTYVQPHFRTQSDNYSDNNFSARGNTNPYTGNRGSVSPPNIFPNNGENDFNSQPSTRNWNNNRPHGSSYRRPQSGM